MKGFFKKAGSAAVTAVMGLSLYSGGFASGSVEKTTQKLTPWSKAEEPAPTIDQLRAGIFLPHYARIQGMFDGLADTVPVSLDLIHDMGRLHVRFMDLEVLADEETYAVAFEEGVRMSEEGHVTSDGLNGYIVAVLASDSKIREQWCAATLNMEMAGVELADANYLTLLSMSPDQDLFKDTYLPHGIVTMENYEDQLPLAARDTIRESAMIARTAFEHLDNAMSGKEPYWSDDFAMEM